ncbi:Uncharacterized protein T310_5446 [Rasamsonia emersonii CBS 393.64]|uniref:Mitochondrial thiamine pyrophosphate carrier 1 n=1 Tax=Rasamsonia emersonii (strain ATCC 16479 / CBS 393.64 / IMI 116815) TaxID=1408163 RepID=A0A0F4YQH3_RASE3|nr:Uncharacterized protein T310_5446 [Rasamsonia emersonii CBS 393.64]KKA20527.1 Uncharacterized protein T310_5446 [Rasamsonia emersonii CBS 393.64]
MSLDRRETARNEQPDNEERKALQSLARLPSPSIKHEKSTVTLISDLEAYQNRVPPSFFHRARNNLSEPVVAAFIAGGVAGAVSRTIVSPLERLKILLQIQSAGRDDYNRLSVWKALVKMGREEGWRGFMRGNGTNCIRIIPYSAVQFGSYNFYKKVSNTIPADSSSPQEPFRFSLLRSEQYCLGFAFSAFHTELIVPQFAEPSPGAELSPISRLICGGIAGITSVTVTYPLDIVRTRLSIQSASFAALGNRTPGEKLPGMFQTMVLMYKNEGGFLALYRGIIPTVAGVAPYVGLNFMVYESVRRCLTPEGDKNPSSFRKLLAGAISGAVAQTCTYPFDVLRRRFQINTMTGMGYHYTSIWDAIKIIVAEEGIRGLYKGIVPNLLKVAPSMASSWLSFEVTRDFFLSLGDK